MRLKKELDLKLLEQEKERLDKLRKDMVQNRGSYDITRLLQDAKNDGSNMDIFERLR